MLNIFHDHEVMSIAHDRDRKNLRMTIRSPEEDIYSLELQGCYRFRVSDFIHQNVISRILFVSGADLDESETRKSLDWMTSLSDSPSFLTSEEVTQTIERLRSGELTMMICIPSYGAEIAALCRGYASTRGERVQPLKSTGDHSDVDGAPHHEAGE